ncbi:MAG: homocysteine S-methyltransferase family protein [Actinomycetota bacterium]|nr:homocysteine S-methyltransferase family protein [Actinomycetota bacterium]
MSIEPAVSSARPPMVLDGGMGRELLRIGAPFQQPEWSGLALWEGPEWVVQAHANFVEAGAEMVTTNSYALVPFHIGEERFAAQGRELAALSSRLARQAADAAGSPVVVAGSLPPLFGSYRPDLFVAERSAAVIDPLVDGLAEHVDLWLGETLGSIVEARTVRAAMDRAGSTVPLWISYTLDDHVPGTLRSGEPVADAVRAAVDLGAQAVLFNCCQAETITAAIATALEAVPQGVATGGYANRFVAGHSGEVRANAGLATFRDDLDPSSYGGFVAEWLRMGATLVGGCCGMEPAHIREIAALVAAA